MPDGQSIDERECRGYYEQLRCLYNSRPQCGGNMECFRIVNREIDIKRRQMREKGCEGRYGVVPPSGPGGSIVEPF